jgi:hypothetical protein
VGLRAEKQDYYTRTVLEGVEIHQSVMGSVSGIEVKL